jgi:hypothetical protein
MRPFFKVLLHLLYFGFVAVAEILVWHWLMPLLGVGVTIAILVVLFIVLMMIYAAIFWKWRPSGDGIGDFFSDIGDFGGDFS